MFESNYFIQDITLHDLKYKRAALLFARSSSQ